jgi:hypothetical protein
MLWYVFDVWLFRQEHFCYIYWRCDLSYTINELHIYLERDLESKKEAKMAEIEGSVPVPIVFVCAEISYFDIDLKNNTMLLWTDNLFSETVYDLHNY